MQKFDMSDIDAATEGAARPHVVPGGYVCKIVGVVDKVPQQYLLIDFDIVEGELKGFFTEQNKRFGGEWPFQGRTIRSYKESARSFFKGFITAVEESNPGYKWNFDERTLKGKRIGIIFGEEEYQPAEGGVKVSCKPRAIVSVGRIEKGDYTVPALRKLNGETAAAPAPVQNPVDLGTVISDSDDLPF